MTLPSTPLYREQDATQGQTLKICNTCFRKLPTWKRQAMAYLNKHKLKDAFGNDQPSLFDGL